MEEGAHLFPTKNFSASSSKHHKRVTVTVPLVFEKPVEIWTQHVTLGGGSCVRQFQADKDSSDIPAGKYDVVVTGHACLPLVEKIVTSQEVPLVSPEWLIQSVICGGFHSKPQYRHDYSL